MSMKNKNEEFPINQGEELIDTFGGFSFYAWSNNTDDYKLIAEAIELWPPASFTMDVLGYVNKYVKGDKYIFDGTVSNLKYLVNNGFLDINDIQEPSLFQGLKNLLKKNLRRTISDVFDEVEDGLILQAIITKHPEFIRFLDYIPQGAKLKELLPKNNEELRVLWDVNENDEENIPIDTDRWSPQAMRCKCVLVGMYINAGKIHISEKSTHLIRVLSTLHDKDIEDRNENKLVAINSMWGVLTASQPWRENRTLTFQQLLRKDFLLMTAVKGSFLSEFYKQHLYPLVKEVASEFYEDFEKHPAYLAIMNSVVIIIYRLIEFSEKKGKRHDTLRFDGIFNRALEYIFTEDGRLQDWFVEHFKNELRERAKIIKLLEKAGTKVNLGDKDAIVYIPVLESFRYYTKLSKSYLPYLLSIFRSKEILPEEKNRIIKPIIFNIQRIIALKLEENDEWENELKEEFSVLMLNIFDPLIKATTNSNSVPGQESFDKATVYDTLKTELFLSILKYDSTIVPNFFGYIKTILPFQKISYFRENKTHSSTKTVSQLSEKYGETNDPDKLEDFINNLFGDDGTIEKMMNSVDDASNKKWVSSMLDSLPPAEKAAVLKAFINNEKLTATENKAKNRGLSKLQNLAKK